MPISGTMEQRVHSIVLPSVFLKGRYYMTKEQDLLTGSVDQKLIRFAFPLFLANLLQALYNVVDMPVSYTHLDVYKRQVTVRSTRRVWRFTVR